MSRRRTRTTVAVVVAAGGSQDRRDGYNKSGHDAFKKKEKVKSLLLRGDM